MLSGRLGHVAPPVSPSMSVSTSLSISISLPQPPPLARAVGPVALRRQGVIHILFISFSLSSGAPLVQAMHTEFGVAMNMVLLQRGVRILDTLDRCNKYLPLAVRNLFFMLEEERTGQARDGRTDGEPSPGMAAWVLVRTWEYKIKRPTLVDIDINNLHI